jgi:amino acid transporter
MQKTNKRKMPVVLLLIQALIVTFISVIFIFMPSITSSYWIIFCLTGQLYLIMYALMFLAALILRYKKPEVCRAFKVPFKNIGMWVLASLGIFASLFSIAMGFVPPKQIDSGNPTFYLTFLTVSIIIFCAIPLIIHQCKKPHWNQHLEEKLNQPPGSQRKINRRR